MKFCSRCGAKLEFEKDTCPQCGYSLGSRQDKPSMENRNVVQVMDSPNSVSKDSTFSMKTKLGIVGISIVAVLLIGLFIVGNSLSKPSKVILKFEKAVASGNKTDLLSILYCDDTRLEINEKSIVPLLNYFKDNPSYLNTTIQSLNSETLSAEQTSSLPKIGTNNSQSVLTLTYTGKRFLFFPSYKIGIKPAFIQIKAGIKDATFSLNSTQIGKSDIDDYSKEFGPFIPGKYKLLADYKGKYVTLSEPHDIDLISANNNKISVDMFTNLNYIKVKSEYPDAELFVNGKDSGVKIAEAQNFGPLSSSTKVYALLTRDGKTLKSNEYTVSQGDTNIYLSFTEAENRVKNLQNQIHDLIYWYTYYFTQAVNTNDFSIVEYCIYPGSKLYDEQKSYIPSTYAQGIKETIMSFNITSCNLNDDNLTGTVTTEEVYNVDNKGVSSIKNFKYKYTFRYNEAKGTYQLESISDD